MADARLQNFVVARLADFCDYRSPLEREGPEDPASYLRAKLLEIEEPLHELKRQLYRDAVAAHFQGPAGDPARVADFKQVLDAYLQRGDFADAVFRLDSMPPPKDEAGRREAREFFLGLRLRRLKEEEAKPLERRHPEWERLVGEIRQRLGLDLLAKVARRTKGDPGRRRRAVLRRLRRQTAEYCTVIHFPKDPQDTFTPFMLPRVEALVAADLRFLELLRLT